MITNHPFASSEPRTRAERNRGDLTAITVPCERCGAESQDHLFVPESERTWARPYSDMGIATLPVPADPAPR